MLEVGARSTDPKLGNSLEVLRIPGPGERILELRRVIKPRTGRTQPHVPWTSSSASSWRPATRRPSWAARQIELGPADALEVPRERNHVNPHNAATEDRS